MDQIGKVSFAMLTNGELHPGSRAFPVVNPATGEPFANAPDCTDDELELAVAAAAAAFTTWRQDESARIAVMLEAADRLDAESRMLGRLMTMEQGKPIQGAIDEIGYAADWLRYYATLDRTLEVVQDDDSAFAEVVRHPIGPVAAITPWNVPIALAFWKVAPALRAGNTVVLKPSPYTPLTTLKAGEVLAAVLPRGVLNVVTGLDPLGAKLVAHPEIRKVTFTGSTTTGRRIAAAAATDLKRITLELGGNDPAIVLDDADPRRAAAGIFVHAMANSGQICVAVKRAYVPRALRREFLDALVELAAKAVVGNGLDERVTIGPINNRPQLERVIGLADAAQHLGAKALAGGQSMDGPGYFYPPTILADANESMAVVAEEQFGPLLPVLEYEDLDDAVARANASPYGLGSSVWTTDRERGAEVAGRLEAGTTWINAHGLLPPGIPFGGVKDSGLGVENGVLGLHEFTDVHVVYQNRAVEMYDAVFGGQS